MTSHEHSSVRTAENYKEMRKILIAGIILFLVYSGLRFIDALYFSGDPTIGIGVLAGGFGLSLLFVCLYYYYPHPQVFPLAMGAVIMVVFMIMGLSARAVDYHYFVMLLVVCLLTSLKKTMPLFIFIAIIMVAAIIMFAFVVPGLYWLDSFRFFTQFMLFLYGSVFILYQTNNVEQKEKKIAAAMVALKHREKMLTAIHDMAVMLLSHEKSEFSDVLNEGLKPITAVEGVDRIAVYRVTQVNGKLGQAYLWHGKTVPLENELRELPRNPPVNRWVSLLMKGQFINGNVKEMREDEARFLEPLGVKSIFMVPVFSGGSFWGVVTLEDHTNYRYFDDNCLDLFEATANLCANVVISAEKEREVKRLRKENEKIYYDGLTGIYNRRYFDERMAYLVKVLSRSHGMLSLMMIDIDYFKKYNDTYGHSAGDECLKAVADIFVYSMARTDDFVARYGGEEFAVVLPNTDEHGARAMAEKLLANIREQGIPHERSDAAPHVTISIGITTGRVEHTLAPEDFVKRADELLYKSKQNGRNRYSFGGWNA
jgi:diguanylate cyclase (GGDEF)-like protein